MTIALATPPARSAPAAHERTLTLADLRKTVSVSSPEISPDGSRVLVSIARQDFKNDRAATDLVLIDARSHAQRRLLRDVRDLGDFRWSPDGSRIAYVARGEDRNEDRNDEDDEPQAQLFILPMDGGAPEQLTNRKEGIGSSIDWRPDGRAIAFVANTAPSNEKAIKAHADEFVVTDEPWTAQSAPTQDDLYEIQLDGAHERRIGNGTWSVGGGFTYARDGRSIFVTRIKGDALPERYLARRIVRIDVASGKQTPVAGFGVMQTDPLRAADGRVAFSFTNPRGSMQTEVALASSDGARPAWISARLDKNVDDAAFLPGGVLVVTANDRTQTNAFRVEPDGRSARLPLGTLSVRALSAARNGAIAFTAAAPDRPTELYLLRPGAKKPVRLTNENGWIAAYALGKPISVTWKTFDGMTADGVLIVPPGWHGGARAPMVLDIHGGPTSASTTAFSGFAQILAAHGWFVFEPNYRGSDNLGLQFARTTVPHITSVPGSDIERGIARVLASYPIDPKRIAVSGWSEGGLMTSWLITHDRRWIAAVDGAAVDDWVQYGDLTDAKDFTPQFIGKSPWSTAAQLKFYRAESPLTFASDVRTPTLILSDAGDYRVPTPLDYEFYHAIRATGTPVEFVVYPVVGHFPTDPVRQEDVFRRWENWLVKHV